MYLDFFGLKEKPFELVPNPKYLFMSNTHRRAMNYLQYGFGERAGFILLTGDVGSGKTTLIRELINRLDDQAVISRVFNTQIDSAQLLGLINMDFGLDVTTLNKVTLLKDLNEFLIDCYGRKERPLLIIDEAQNLSNETLEEIRLLSNLESENEKLLQIIMVGQPELQTVLGQDSMAQLRQRLSVSCHLGPIAADEVSEYFSHRLECAGNREAVFIPNQGYTLIHDVCRGIPRLINILGDYLMLAAFSDQVTNLSVSFVQDVIKELGPSVAFSGQFAPQEEGDTSKKTQSTGLPELEEGYEHLEAQQRKHEEILKKITRQQVVQIDRIEDQLDAICSSIHAIELELKTLTKKESERLKKARNNLTQVITKVK